MASSDTRRARAKICFQPQHGSRAGRPMVSSAGFCNQYSALLALSGYPPYKKGHVRSEVHKIINYCINIHCSERLSQRSRKPLELIKQCTSPKFTNHHLRRRNKLIWSFPGLRENSLKFSVFRVKKGQIPQ